MANVFNVRTFNSDPISGGTYGYNSYTGNSSITSDTILIANNPTCLILQKSGTTIILRMSGDQTSNTSWTSIKIGTTTKTRTSATVTYVTDYTNYSWTNYPNPFSSDAGGETQISMEGTLSGGYGIRIANDNGDNIVDTRTDKMTTVVKSGTIPSVPSPSSSIVSGRDYCITTSGNQTSYGAPNNTVGTLYTATSTTTTTGAQAEIKYITGLTDILSTNTNEHGLLLADAPNSASGLSLAYRTHPPDGGVIDNNKYGVTSNGTAGTFDVIVVRY